MTMGRVKPISMSMNDAARELMRVISGEYDQAGFKEFLKLDIKHFVEPRIVDEFVHLCAYLTHNAIINGSLKPDYRNFESIAKGVDGTDWAIPFCVTMLEVRMHKNSLDDLTDIEKSYILKFYGVNLSYFSQSSFEFYRSGTTSIIFRSNDVAIKIIRPVYIVDPEIASLDRYAKKYKDAANQPKIFDQSAKYLAMELIKGLTIYECIHNHSDLGLDSQKRTEIALKIVDAVAAIHRQHQPHGDLSPRNIIWDGDGNIKFIDYGINYSLKRPLLSIEAQREALRYLHGFDDRDAIKSDEFSDDIFAVGGIILDLIMADGITDHFDLLDEYFKELPDHDIPILIEDCLAPDPEMRLARFRDPDRSHLLIYRLSEELKQASIEDSAAGSISEKGGSILANLMEFVELFSALLNPDKKYQTHEGKRNFRTLFFRKLCQFLTGIVISLALASLYASLGRGGDDMLFKLSGLKNWWSDLGFSLTSKNASAIDQLPGHLICISFLFLASKYYLSIFAKLKLVDSDKFNMKKAQLVIWTNSFGFIIPISYCFLLDPKSWPFCSAIGLFLVAYNNRTVLNSLKSISLEPYFKKVAAKKSADAERYFSRIFGGWARLVSWYAVGLILAGLVLSTSTAAKNPLLDRVVGSGVSYNTYEIFSAIAVMGINYFKMQRENCGALAPSIRNMIRRYFTAAESILSKQAAAVRPAI